MNQVSSAGATRTASNAAGLNPTVAMSMEFLSQAAKLPAAVHAKVLKWSMLFQTDPTAPGINYENIHSRDPNLKSVRIDQDWRGIVHKPERGNVYTLLYVDRHDAAYAWAKTRKIAINRVTGAMQLVMLEHVETSGGTQPAPVVLPIAGDVGNQQLARADQTSKADDSAAASATAQAVLVAQWSPFTELTDHQLLSLGVPEDWMLRVRQIATEDALDGLQSSLPIEAYEGLFLVGAGDTVESVLGSRETRVDRQVDTEDYAAALQTPESQSRFVIVPDDAAMAAMLNAPLAQWRVFLHPTQNKLANGPRSGPVRVLGGAGTGKTVVAMHRVRWLAEHATAPGMKVLFTTFTRNLARDIEESLRSMCSPATLARIEVLNLDAWVFAFLRARRYPHRIIYDRRDDAGARAAWDSALAVKDGSLDLPDGFYEEELEQIVLAQGVTTRDEYRTVRRTGRGVVLSRGKRDAVWPVFDEYRRQAATRQLKDVDDAYRDTAALLETESEQEGKKAVVNQARYASIVVDETQDFGPQALRLLRAMVPREANDLFFVGDGHQRIYPRNRAAMSKCGIDIRGRSRKLYLNYRTTAEIRAQAVALLEGVDVDDLDEGHDELRRYKSLSHGPKPSVVRADSLDEAIAKAVDTVKTWELAESTNEVGDDRATRTCAVLVRSAGARDAIEQRLRAQGMKTVVIDKDQSGDPAPPVIRLATLHRAKGLEFDHVVVVGRQAALGDLEETAQERMLLYVALTRAKWQAALILY